MREEWLKDHGKERILEIEKMHTKNPPLDIVIKGDNLKEWARKLGGKVIANTCVRLQSKGRIENIKGYKEGVWWIQDFAAQLPCKFLGTVKNKHIIDLCASPGGKTAQLVNEGAKVTSIEISDNRAKTLKLNLSRLGYSSRVNILIQDAKIWKPKEKAEGLILDVPCSATGTIRRNPDILWRKSPFSLNEVVEKQRELLFSALKMVLPGAPIVYSNCSLFKREGEEVIEYIVKHSNVKIKPIMFSEIKKFKNFSLNKGMLRTMPYMYEKDGGMDGFFIARLVK